MVEHGFRSQIAGTLKIDPTEHVDKRTLRFMGPGAAYAHIAMAEAIADAGLDEADIVNPRTGLVAGSGRALDQRPADGASDGAWHRCNQADRPVCGAQMHVLDDQRQPGDGLQDQGHQLFHHLGLLDQPALHRQCGWNRSCWASRT